VVWQCWRLASTSVNAVTSASGAALEMLGWIHCLPPFYDVFCIAVDLGF